MSANEADYTADDTMMWPDITSPVARRVMSAVFHVVSLPLTGAAEDTGAQYGGPEEMQMRNELREQLRESGLAQRIAAGPQMMPLLYDYMPWLYRQLTRHEVPKTPEQLAVHILRHLDWYLDNPKPVRAVPAALKVTVVIVLALVSLLATLAALFLPGLLLFVTGFIYVLFATGSNPEFNLVRHQVLQSEYFYYLRETYGESWHDE